MRAARNAEHAIEHYELAWRRLKIRVAYERHAFGGPNDMYRVSHLQIENAARREPLPISETGYKSAFIPGGEVEASGGVVAFVTRWLDAAALRPEWKALEREQRQGRLF